MLNVNEIVLGFLAAVLILIALVMLHGANRYKYQAAIRRAVIEKFGSAHDLGEFLQTPDGQRVISDFFSESTGRAPGSANTPVRSVLASIHKGILILSIGAALMVIGFLSEREIAMVGGLLVALGLGFLVSAAITRRLSQRWGLAEDPGPRSHAGAL